MTILVWSQKGFTQQLDARRNAAPVKIANEPASLSIGQAEPGSAQHVLSASERQDISRAASSAVFIQLQEGSYAA
jgi:hypothetical protein